MFNTRRRGRVRWYAAGLAGLTGVASVATFSGAAAATDTNGAIPCSAEALIAAIVRGNATGGARLTLTRSCTYTLTAAQGPDGLPLITQPISIDGQGATITRAAAATNFRILNVGVGGNLTLNNLTITGGFAPDPAGGGGILVQAGGQAALRNTTVVGNQSTSDGGGIANYGITTLLADTRGAGNKVAGNSTRVSGGGIYNEGQLTTTDAEVSHNTSNIEGGGITDRGTAVLEQTRIEHNRADAGGGGLTTVVAVTKLSDSSVSSNTTGGDGGGIECVASTLYASGSKIDRNTAADDGGGIYNQSVPAPQGGPALAVVDDSEVDGNTASGDGGGIANVSGDLVVRRSHVSFNQDIGTASQGGGGILNSFGRVSLTATEVAENSSTVAPGGVSTDNDEVTVDQRSVIVANRPTNCAGSPVAVPNCFG